MKFSTISCFLILKFNFSKEKKKRKFKKNNTPLKFKIYILMKESMKKKITLFTAFCKHLPLLVFDWLLDIRFKRLHAQGTASLLIIKKIRRSYCKFYFCLTKQHVDRWTLDNTCSKNMYKDILKKKTFTQSMRSYC